MHESIYPQSGRSTSEVSPLYAYPGRPPNLRDILVRANMFKQLESRETYKGNSPM